MSVPSVFETAADLLEDHFTSDPAERKGGYLTGYAAVKSAFGVERDDHPIAYNGSAWSELRDRMNEAFSVLDEITAETSVRGAKFIAWCRDPDVTHEDVKSVLAEAARRRPDLTVENAATLRPSTPKMPGAHKLRWIICNQLGTIAAGRDTPVGEVIRSILPVDGISDWELIARLDDIIDLEDLPREAAEKTQVHVALSRAWGKRTRRDPSFSFADALAAIGPNAFWGTGTDSEIEEAALRFAADPANAVDTAATGPLLG